MWNIVRTTLQTPAKKKHIAYTNVFSTPDGKTLLKNLIINGGVYRTGIPRNVITGKCDELALAYNNGRRDIVLEILSVLNLKAEDLSDLNNDINNGE